MQEQSMLEIIDEVCTKLGDQYESAFLLDGQRMKSPLEVPIEARIIVVSKNEEFHGLRGLENFDSHA